jgi:hypothetical protein
MNDIERTILENQKAIMEFLISQHKDFHFNLIQQNIKSDGLLNPKVNNESACDMSNLDEMDAKEDAQKDAFGGKTE